MPSCNNGPSATTENSIGFVARFRVLPLLPLLGAAVLLVVAEPLTLRSARVGGRTVQSVSAGAHHGYALAILAVALVAFGVLALRGSRAAGLGAIVVAALSLWIVLGVDRPALDDAGLIGGRFARATTGPAWRFELVGAILALVGAAAVALSAGGQRRH